MPLKIYFVHCELGIMNGKSHGKADLTVCKKMFKNYRIILSLFGLNWTRREIYVAVVLFSFFLISADFFLHHIG